MTAMTGSTGQIFIPEYLNTTLYTNRYRQRHDMGHTAVRELIGTLGQHTPGREEPSLHRTARRLGLACLLLAIVGWSVSIPLHCSLRAALVGGCAFLNGGLFGLCLALVTRVRRPVWIYFWLLLAALTFWPLWHDWPLWQGWPIGDPATIRLWRGAPAILTGYYDILRFCLFLLGLPFPFARFGQHGPDPLPPEDASLDTSETPKMDRNLQKPE